jgi:hypothetical protein
MNAVLTAAKTLTKNAKALVRLNAQIAKVDARLGSLETKRTRLMDAASALTSGIPATSAKPARKARKTGKKVARKGAARKGAGRPKGSLSPTSLSAVLLRVAPASNQDAVNKDALVKAVEKTGYKSKAKDLKVVVGQALSGKAGLFAAAERGLWRRTKAGDEKVAQLAATK